MAEFKDPAKHLDFNNFQNVKHSFIGEMIPRVSLTRLEEGGTFTALDQYNVVKESNAQLKITLSKKAGIKRKSSDDDNNDNNNNNEGSSGTYSQSLSERVKRRRGNGGGVVEGWDEWSSDGGGKSCHGDFEVKKHKDKRKKKYHHHHHQGHQRRSLLALQDGIRDDLMEATSFKKFYLVMEEVLEQSEEVDLTALKADDDDVGEMSCLSEPIISRHHLCELVSEAAKLKSMSFMNQIPYERLVKLLTLMRFSVKQGLKCMTIEELVDTEGEDEQLFRQLTLDHVETSLDACLASIIIITSPDMPKQVFLEDVIEEVVGCTRKHLCNIIFPLFDPIYRPSSTGKSVRMKRSRAGSSPRDRTTTSIYNKLTELTALLSELVQVQQLTDSIILQISSLSVSPFFVENIPELQLNALKLVTNIFSKYDKHRGLILEDILSSLARLPSSKKNVRSYRLNSEEHIQMVTALALQLIQCVVKLPSKQEHFYGGDDDDDDDEGGNDNDVKAKSKRSMKEKSLFTLENESLILSSYDTSINTAHNFLHVFLGKCSSKEEEDYRSIFSNFVTDLLSTVNKPEWPASELILSILGSLLVKQFSCKTVEMSLRVASLDYLGIVAARLRKDAVTSHMDEDVVDDVVSKLMDQNQSPPPYKALDSSLDEDLLNSSHESKFNELQIDESNYNDGANLERTEVMQKGLLTYLERNSLVDPSLVFARKFYLAQWLRDCRKQIETQARKVLVEKKKRKKKKKKKKSRRRLEEADDADDDTNDEDGDDDDADEAVKQLVEKRKVFLFREVELMHTRKSSIKQSPSKLDTTSALLVTRYLASNRPFSHSFDIYLTQILKVLEEHAVAVRSRALKCLSVVVEADPSVLARPDMQNAVQNRFLDNSTSVREAVVELVGKFILVQPSLTPQYYPMLSVRILDKGISVRKRVIKIFRDICLEQPSFCHIPEMCVKMVCRVNDEEGIRKLVNETFQCMWFTPCRGVDQQVLLQKVHNISSVVALASSNIGFDWLEQLMDNLLRREEGLADKAVLRACSQVVDCMVDNLLNVESNQDGSRHMGASFLTLYLFCKVQPQLMVKHCATIHPYLNIKFTHQSDTLIVSNTLKMLQLSLPLLEHPGETFLAKLEEDVAKLILKHGTTIIQSCISCLSSIICDITHNFKLAHDCFVKFYSMTLRIREWQETGFDARLVEGVHTKLRRSLFVTGLLCKHFDFDEAHFLQFSSLSSKDSSKDSNKDSSKDSNKASSKDSSCRDRVFELLMHFLSFPDHAVQLKSLTALGFLSTRHYELMLSKELRDIYHLLLTYQDDDDDVDDDDGDGDKNKNNVNSTPDDVNEKTDACVDTMTDTNAPTTQPTPTTIQPTPATLTSSRSGMYLLPSMRCQVLLNIKDYLAEEESKMAKADAEWRKQQEKEDLKEMGDVQSGMASTITQVFLRQILESFFHLHQQVRMAALDVIVLILNQGLVHPQQCMAHLICMGSDPVLLVRLKADKQIQEIDRKYPGFVQAKAMQGIKMSCRLQRVMHRGGGELRGVRKEEDGSCTSLNSYIYSVVRSNRSNRRVLVMNALRMFEENTSLEELVYMSDNLAYFPYQTQDEVLFIMHHIDLILSVSGSNLLHSFREVFHPPPAPPNLLFHPSLNNNITDYHSFNNQQQPFIQQQQQQPFLQQQQQSFLQQQPQSFLQQQQQPFLQQQQQQSCLQQQQTHTQQPHSPDKLNNVSEFCNNHDNSHTTTTTTTTTNSPTTPTTTTINCNNNVTAEIVNNDINGTSKYNDVNVNDNHFNNVASVSNLHNNNPPDNNHCDNLLNGQQITQPQHLQQQSQQQQILQQQPQQLLQEQILQQQPQQQILQQQIDPNIQKYEDDDDEDEDLATLLELVAKDGRVLYELHQSLQGYRLMLMLKQHLKDMYGFTDRKVQSYAPSDAKLHEKPLNRKHNINFQPKPILVLLNKASETDLRTILQAYLDFKELMASIDQEDMSDEATPPANSSASRLVSAEPCKEGTSVVMNRSTNVTTPRRLHKAPLVKKTPRHHKPPIKKKKKRKRLSYDDDDDEDDDDYDDDDDDDEDYEG